MTDNAKLEAAIADLAGDLKPLVEAVESDLVPVTKDNYGRYLDVISAVAQGDKERASIVFLALKQAGAGAGADAAFKIIAG